MTIIKTTLILFFGISTLTYSSCKQKVSESESIKLINSVEAAMKEIENYSGDVKDFKLGLNNTLTYKNKEMPRSFALAIITDVILKKGWMVNGVQELKNGTIHSYKKME